MEGWEVGGVWEGASATSCQDLSASSLSPREADRDGGPREAGLASRDDMVVGRRRDPGGMTRGGRRGEWGVGSGGDGVGQVGRAEGPG